MSKVNVCPVCQFDNPSGAKFCMDCGGHLDSSDVGENSDIEQMPVLNNPAAETALPVLNKQPDESVDHEDTSAESIVLKDIDNEPSSSSGVKFRIGSDDEELVDDESSEFNETGDAIETVRARMPIELAFRPVLPRNIKKALYIREGLVEPKLSKKALFSLLFSLIGFIPPFGILAVVFGLMARQRIKKSDKEYLRGGGMAVTGISIGIFATLFTVAMAYPSVQFYKHKMYKKNINQINRIARAVDQYDMDQQEQDVPRPVSVEALINGGYLTKQDFVSPLAKAGEESPHYQVIPQNVRNLDDIRVYETAKRHRKGRLVGGFGIGTYGISEPEWDGYAKHLTVEYHQAELFRLKENLRLKKIRDFNLRQDIHYHLDMLIIFSKSKDSYYLEKILMFIDENQLRDAEQLIKAYQQLVGNEAWYELLRSRISIKQQKYEQAVDQLANAYSLAPDNLDIILNFARLKTEVDAPRKEQLELYRKFLNKAPRKHPDYQQVSKLLAKLEQL